MKEKIDNKIKKTLDFLDFCGIISVKNVSMKGEWGNPLTFVYHFIKFKE